MARRAADRRRPARLPARRRARRPDGDAVIPRWWRPRPTPTSWSRAATRTRADHCSFAAQGGIWPVALRRGHRTARSCTPRSRRSSPTSSSTRRPTPDRDAYSAFDGTGLADALRARGVDRLRGRRPRHRLLRARVGARRAPRGLRGDGARGRRARRRRAAGRRRARARRDARAPAPTRRGDGARSRRAPSSTSSALASAYLERPRLRARRASTPSSCSATCSASQRLELYLHHDRPLSAGRGRRLPRAPAPARPAASRSPTCSAPRGFRPLVARHRRARARPAARDRGARRARAGPAAGRRRAARPRHRQRRDRARRRQRAARRRGHRASTSTTARSRWRRENADAARACAPRASSAPTSTTACRRASAST